MPEDKPIKHGVDDVQKHEEQRRDTYSPEHGTGNPHKNWDDAVPLRDSEAWKAHKSHVSVKPKK